MRPSLPAAAAAAVMALAACRGAQAPDTIVASGHVEATDVRISTKVAGRLASMEVEEGDAVSVGQPLARIDTTDLELALRQARAERDQAAAELRLRLAGYRQEDIAELEAQIRATRADLEAAERDLQRMQGLYARGSGTEKLRDDARTRRDVGAARLQAQQQSLARLRAGFRVEEKDAARARLRALEARVAQLEQQVADATITSPAGGVVTEKIAEAGELLQVGSAVCVLTRLDDAWLNVYVSEPDLGRVRLGQAAEVVTDDGQRRQGKVSFIASRAEFTPKNVQTRDERVKLVFKVKLALPNQDGLFKPGMPAEARFAPATGAAQ
ncbi:MAG: efflux RND transporter periplasmic adaptor subunit [Vicinamibacteria bacterium]